MYVFLLIYACWWSCAIGENAPYYALENVAEYFEEFIIQHDKHYADDQEKQARLQIFKQNLEDVNRLNEESSLRTGGPTAVFGKYIL